MVRCVQCGSFFFAKDNVDQIKSIQINECLYENLIKEMGGVVQGTDPTRFDMIIIAMMKQTREFHRCVFYMYMYMHGGPWVPKFFITI